MPTQKPFVRFVTRKWPPAVGGMETYSKRLADLLPEHVDLDVVALPGQENGNAPEGWRLVLFGLRTFAALMFSRRPADVTHVADLASWPLALAARLRNRSGRIVLSAHGTDVSYCFRTGPRNRIYRWYLGQARKALPGAIVIANSTATSDALRQLGFADARVIPLAADSVEAGPPPDPQPHVLFAGRIIRRKGLSWFVFSVLPDLPPEVTLNAAGPVWESDEAKCLDEDRVTYLGTLAPDALRDAYRAALCVIVPNLDMEIGHLEGFGLVATEAAAAGAVVLASATGGLTDAVLDEKTGFLLPAGDPEAWAAKVAEIRQWSPATRAAFIERSQALCRTHFSWQRVARETAALYRSD